jgi:hypothetical protein
MNHLKPNSIEAYISGFPKEIQGILKQTFFSLP